MEPVIHPPKRHVPTLLLIHTLSFLVQELTHPFLSIFMSEATSGHEIENEARHRTYLG